MNSFSQKDSNGQHMEKQQNAILWFFSWFIRRPGMQLLFLIVAITLPAIIIALTVLIPAAAFNPMPVKAESNDKADTTRTKKVEATADQHPLYLNILNKEQKLSFIQNRLELARQDSIYLVLNLQDSVLDIEIKGLPVQRCKIQSYHASSRLKAAQHEDLQKWLETPFTLQGEISTIPKVPVLLVDAPKDTTEAAKLPKKPMEPEKTAVFFTLLFDKNLVIEIEQTEAILPEEEVLMLNYQHRFDSLFSRTLLQKIIQPMPQQLPIHIKLRMNEGDARAIYRSIPHSKYAKMIINPLDESM
jgi:hypothetical protein